MLIKNLNEIKPKSIVHGNSKKYPFEELGFKSQITQTAIGKMNKNSLCDFHKHDSMIEIFISFQNGNLYCKRHRL